jgi:hypothetical protein
MTVEIPGALETFYFASKVDQTSIFVRKWLPRRGIRPRATNLEDVALQDPRGEHESWATRSRGAQRASPAARGPRRGIEELKTPLVLGGYARWRSWSPGARGTDCRRRDGKRKSSSTSDSANLTPADGDGNGPTGFYGIRVEVLQALKGHKNLNER